jgi:glutathione S-transferase/GST-like protein
MEESARRIRFGVEQLEGLLSAQPWVAGQTYSLADVAGFNMAAGLPMMMTGIVNDQTTPHLMEWLRKIYERPAVHEALKLGRTEITRRYTHLARTA